MPKSCSNCLSAMWCHPIRERVAGMPYCANAGTSSRSSVQLLIGTSHLAPGIAFRPRTHLLVPLRGMRPLIAAQPLQRRLNWYLGSRISLNCIYDPLPAGNATEAKALLRFKDGLTKTKGIANWDASTDVCSGWTGVRCNPEGQVTKLDISMKSLEGPVDWEALATLSSLSELNLEVNELSGTLPRELPPSLSVLRLGDNRATGQLGGLRLPPVLKELWLESNQLTGTLPGDWDLGGLELLNLNGNRLTGTIPAGFAASATSLNTLYLSANRFEGTLVPSWPGRDSPIQSLYLGSNLLEGPLPADWELPQGLYFLSVGSNQLSQTLPPNWQLPQGLGVLQLENNSFTGPVLPPSWSLPPSLTDISFALNDFTGTLTPDFTFPEGLMFFDASNNNLTGEIPTGWHIPNSAQLHFYNNSLSGTLPSWPNNTLTLVDVIPQAGPGFCGEVPKAPQYRVVTVNPDEPYVPLPPDGLPSCQPAPGSSPAPAPGPPGPSPQPDPAPPEPSGVNITGVVAGVVGGVAASAAVLALLIRRRAKRRRMARDDSEAQYKAAAPDTPVTPIDRSNSKPDDPKDVPTLNEKGLVAVGDLSNAQLLLLMPSRPAPNPHWSSRQSPLQLLQQRQRQQQQQWGQSRAEVTPTDRSLPSSAPLPSPATATGTASGSTSDEAYLERARLAGGIWGSPPLSPFAAVLADPQQPGARAGVGSSSNNSSRDSQGRGGSFSVPTDSSRVGSGAPLLRSGTLSSGNNSNQLVGSPDGSSASEWDAIFATAAATAAAASAAQAGQVAALIGLPTEESRGEGGLFVPRPESGRSRSRRGSDYGSTADWELDPSTIELCTHEDGALVELGAGGFGKVYKGLRSGVTPVAVKLLRQEGQRALSKMRGEVEVMTACRDPNIVQFYGACIRGDFLMLCTEFMPGGDLSKSLSLPEFRWYKRGRQVALDVVRGLVFMHQQSILHLDLKSSNILLSDQGKAKIADMGLSRFLTQDYLTQSIALGTFAWASPEVILGKPCTSKADIYSLGVLIWEIVTGEMPFRGQLRSMRTPEECPQAVATLVEACMDPNPKRRPTARQVYAMLAAAEAAEPTPAASGSVQAAQ